MAFLEDIAKVSEKVRKHADQVLGEEATKQALILPFLSALGYDIYDPTEVKPEYVADFATRVKPLKKVDYAVAINDNIVMLVEAKARGQKPEMHDGQLAYYFNSLIATKIGIVSNGVEYRFFTDLDNENVIDKEPFFSFNILELQQKDIDNLKLFHRDNFDAANIKRHAEEMVYVKKITKIVGEILRSPSKDFIRFLLSQLDLDGKINNKKIEKFEPIIKRSIQNSLVELITRSVNEEWSKPDEPEKTEEDIVEEVEEKTDNSQVVTTAEELEAFAKIKAIAETSKTHQLKVNYKDVVSYFGLHVGNSTWWFLRLYLSTKKKSFVTRLPVNEVKALAPGFEVQELSAPQGGAASRVFISSVSDLDKLVPLVLKCYETEAAKH